MSLLRLSATLARPGYHHTHSRRHRDRGRRGGAGAARFDRWEASHRRGLGHLSLGFTGRRLSFVFHSPGFCIRKQGATT
jgi:hypothetical protein